MLQKQIELLRFIIKTIVENTVSTLVIVLETIVQMYILFIKDIQTASPRSLLVTILVLGSIGYFLYKFLWSSAKTIVLFFILIVMIFFISLMII